MERVLRVGLLWFCNWNKNKMAEGADEYRVSLFSGCDIVDWTNTHPDWFVFGEWNKERYAFPVQLTDAGRAALANRERWDMEDVQGGMVEPGWVCSPARPSRTHGAKP